MRKTLLRKLGLCLGLSLALTQTTLEQQVTPVSAEESESTFTISYTGDEILQYAKDTYDDYGYEEVDTCTGLMSHVYYEDLQIPIGMDIIGWRVNVGYGKDPYNGIWTRYNPDGMLANARKAVEEGKAICVYEGKASGVYDDDVEIHNGDIVIATAAEQGAQYGHVAMMEVRDDGTIGWWGAHGPAKTKAQEVGYQPFARDDSDKEYDSPTGDDFPGYHHGYAHIFRVVDYADLEVFDDITYEKEITYTLTAKKTTVADGLPVADVELLVDDGKTKNTYTTSKQGTVSASVTKTVKIDPDGFRYTRNYSKLKPEDQATVDSEGIYKSYQEAQDAANEALLFAAQDQAPDFSEYSVTDPETNLVYTLNSQPTESSLYNIELSVEDVRITKHDITIVGLSTGAKCQLLDSEGNILEEFITDEIGNDMPGYVAKNLDEGSTYTIKELHEPYGYLKSEDIPFTVENSDDIIYLEEKPILGTLNITSKGKRYDGYENKNSDYIIESLEGVIYTVYAAENIKSGTRIVYSQGQEVMSSTDSVDNLPVGHYYFEVSEVPAGYVKSSKRYDFSVDSSDLADPVYEQEVVLDQQTYTINVSNLVQNNDLKSSDTVGVYSADTNKLLYSSTISENGVLTASKESVLPIGSYYLKAEGSSKKIEFNVSEKDPLISDYTLTLKSSKDTTKANMMSKGSITVTLKDSDDSNNILSGYEFLLSTTETFDTVLQSVQTDEHGQVVFSGLDYETYYIKQNAKGKVYANNTTIYELTLTADMPDVGFTIQNHMTSLLIDSKDLGGVLAVPGVTLTLKDSSGNVVDTWTTERMSHLVSGLTEGETYTVVPEDSAEGYNKASEVEFVMSDGLLVTVKSKEIQSVKNGLVATTMDVLSDPMPYITWANTLIGSFSFSGLVIMLKRPFSKNMRKAYAWNHYRKKAKKSRINRGKKK